MRGIWKHQRKVARQLSARHIQPLQSRPTTFPAPWKSSVVSSSRLFSSSIRHYDFVESVTAAATTNADDLNLLRQSQRLPLSCPGCGAPSQTIASDEAGYYNLTRSGVKNYLKEETKEEDNVMDRVLNNVDKKTLSSLGLADGIKDTKAQVQRQTPICDRCHNLIHHSGSSSTPILHPSIESIQSIIEESPHKQNHIYHIIDAADFPLSVIPNLASALSLPRLRTQNRRSKTQKFMRGRVAEVSFIITRSDLLAPQKEQVDGLMPYLRETLRDALGKSGEKIRLGNVRCVSSKRGWWTKHVKEEVWDRGGAGWMVGKVNAGKSAFFDVVFPKGRGAEVPSLHNLRQGESKKLPLFFEDDLPTPAEEEQEVTPLTGESLADLPGDISSEDKTITTSHVITEPIAAEAEQPQEDDSQFFDQDDEASLLPPAQIETQYPLMPVISSLPGTTASPIRIPFGSGRGELIDLPGIHRTDLDQHVRPENRDDLVMKTRITPEQYTIKPGQSLLLGGGLIRITPTDPDIVVLAYPFVPLLPHVTATAKAEAMQTGERESGIKSILAEGVMGETGNIKSAGKFKLQWDVTRKRAGPLTSNSAVKMSPEKLPFIIYSADLLVEGVGWVELVAQVRKKQRARPVVHSTISDHDRVREEDEKVQDEPVTTFKPFAPDHGEKEATTSNSTSFTPENPSTRETGKQTYSPFNAPAQEQSAETGIEAGLIPEIEIFTPTGSFVAIRPPMNAYLLGGKKNAPVSARKARPRLSMKSLRTSQEGRRREY